MIKEFFLFLFFIFVQIVLKPITIKNVDPNQPPLSDLGHNFIPEINSKYMLICDIILVFMFMILSIFVDSCDIFTDFFKKGSLLLFMRSISILLTDLPQLKAHLCFRNNNKDFNCTNDYMFSGHTSITLLIALFIANANSYLYIPMVGIYVLQIFLILSTRMHYSIDVFIATILTTLVYKLQM